MKKPKILISACLCGIPCRYDSKSSPLSCENLSRLKSSFTLIPVCPEQLGGLPSPRKPAEIIQGTELIKNPDGEDLTTNFKLGAQLALNICKNYGIKIAVLKSKSPSCGKGRVYDGSFSGLLVNGNGFTCDSLLKNGIMVVEDNQLMTILP